MSGALSSLAGISALLSRLTGWRLQLRQGSYRGVQFYMDVGSGAGGRRMVTHQIPQNDTPLLEDLGQRANVYRIRAFVVGDAYMTQRDALIKAVQNNKTAGPLVHPTLGNINVRPGEFSWTEDPKTLGGYCAFEISFHREGKQPAAATDTASKLLAGIVSMTQTAVAAYQTASLISQNPALLVGFAGTLLGGASGSILGMSTTAITGLATIAIGITAAVTNNAATAAAVNNTFQTAAGNIVTAQADTGSANDSVLGTPATIAPAADLTGGMAALTTWGDTLAAPTGAGTALAQMQAQQAAIVALVEGAAVMGVMTIYASTTFTSSNDAAAARTALLAMVDRQTQAANLAGADDLYRAWQALGALAINDMIARAQNLPNLVTWTQPSSRPSVVLAQEWYQDATRAEEIAGLNDVPHPMFMPLTGVRLSV